MPNFYILLVLVMFVGYVSASTRQLQDFEREFKDIFLRIIHDNCSTEYANYVSHNESAIVNDMMMNQQRETWFIRPVLDCILEKTSETIKSNMASAQVVLGLTPTILAMLGPSTEESSTLFIIGRRPLLAVFVALGTPAVYPARAFEYQNPLETLLRERQGRLRMPRYWIGGGIVDDVVITVGEYLLVSAAVANMIQLGVELGRRVVFTCAPETTYMPLLWGLLGLLIHVLAAVGLGLRAHVSGGKKSCNRLLNLIKIHFIPLIKLRPLYVRLERETLVYIVLMWFSSVFTVCHIIFGTLIFSSMLFISVRDAMYVIGRLMSSAIVCRGVLMYELAALRDSFNVGDAIASGFPSETLEITGDNLESPILKPPMPVRVGTWESDRSYSSGNIVVLK